ncbi:MAG: enoyl-CoA hydratase-related protein [Chitinophagaceae bacterium]|nr:enoyl-CoA hydratase-related protein [Chitinophagaceae bacterium]
MYTNILLKDIENIRVITINRPDKLNALNQSTLQELEEIIQNIYSDTLVRGVIITGAGEKSFVAGADIQEFKAIAGRALARKGQKIFQLIEDCEKPIIAAVNGFAFGGGCELAMSCHIIVASENAKFGQPEIKLGIIPGYGGTQRLTRLIGKSKALELILTGESIDAKEALFLKLVNHVVPADSLLDKCHQILSNIVNKSPTAVTASLKAVQSYFTSPDGYETELECFEKCCETNDFIEGVNAFLEKRKPVFLGK